MTKFYIDRIQALAKTSSPWEGTDTKENYRFSTPLGKNLYSQTDITYAHNECGFRCDDFGQVSELPILFLGCSNTFGVGVKLEETWTYLLHSKIKEATKKNIPYWSLAHPGFGVDSNARSVYWFAKHFQKPAYVFSMFAPLTRREYSYESSDILCWVSGKLPNQITGKKRLTNLPFITTKVNEINQVFSDQAFSLHQARQSLELLDAVTSRSTVLTTQWNTEGEFEPEVNLIKEFFPFITCPAVYDTKYPRGRDTIHIGPTPHQMVAEAMWNRIKSDFE
jgi:hypothetical protein